MDARLEKTIEKEGGYSTGKDGKDGTPTGEAKIVDTSYLKEVLIAIQNCFVVWGGTRRIQNCFLC